MATHKVPQDVEAEDKLLGPLSLRQLIFTILGLGFGYLVYFFFANIHPIASIIWLPFCMFFLVLGLYQRKDQPAEVFLASALQFHIKPRKRIWNQEGYEERVIITAPPKVEKQYTKSFTGEQAVSRLNNLSSLMDSRGWASKVSGGLQNPQLAQAASSDRLAQPMSSASAALTTSLNAPDIQDESSSAVARDISARMQQSDSATRQQAFRAVENARREAPAIPKEPTLSSAPQTVTSPAPVPPDPVEQSHQEPSITSPSIAPPPTTQEVKVAEEPVPKIQDDGAVEISLR